MKFDYWDGSTRNVYGLEIRNPFQLANRSCDRCKGTVFYEAYITSVDSENLHRGYFAICEGCKLLVDLS